MKFKLLIGSAAILAVMSPVALAEDWEAICLEEVQSADVPPEVTEEQIATYCSCYGAVIASDPDYVEEARKLIAMSREERGDAVSQELSGEEVACQEEAMSQ